MAVTLMLPTWLRWEEAQEGTWLVWSEVEEWAWWWSRIMYVLLNAEREINRAAGDKFLARTGHPSSHLNLNASWNMTIGRAKR